MTQANIETPIFLNIKEIRFYVGKILHEERLKCINHFRKLYESDDLPIDRILRRKGYEHLPLKTIIDINNSDFNSAYDPDDKNMALILQDNEQVEQFENYQCVTIDIKKAYHKKILKQKKIHNQQYLTQKARKNELISLFKLHPICMQTMFDDNDMENTFEILGY